MTGLRTLLIAMLAAAAVGCGGHSQESVPAPGPAGGAELRPHSGESSAIMLSIDGLDRAVLREMLAAGRLPNLAALARAGSLREIRIEGHDTETRPGHASMLTGHSAEQTGVSSNGSPDDVPKGLSVFERLKTTHGRDGIRTALIAAKPYVSSLFDAAAEAGAIDTRQAVSGRAGEVARVGLESLAKWRDRRFFAFLHFRDPDSAGHMSGRASREYREAAEACDRALGEVVAWLEKEKLRDRVCLYVLADHGFDAEGRSHSNAPDSWLITDDRTVKKDGVLADVAATVLARLGVAVEKLEPALLGRPLTAPAAPGESAPAPRPSEKPAEVQPVPAPAG
jgi:predicted AlkP superfamily pyrophosphatase or phosphodiesterase